MSERMPLLGFGDRQSQTVAAVLEPVTGELSVQRSRGEPARVVPAFLDELDRPARRNGPVERELT